MIWVPLLACPAVQGESSGTNTAGQAGSGTRRFENQSEHHAPPDSRAPRGGGRGGGSVLLVFKRIPTGTGPVANLPTQKLDSTATTSEH